MKKNFLFVGAMIAMFAIGMSTVLVSCEKDTEKSSKSRSADDDDDEDEDKGGDINGCKCAVYYEGENMGTEKISIEEMEDIGISSCSKLQRLLNEEVEGYDIEYKCKEY